MDALKRLSPYTHWLLRIALAAVFLYHGWGKITNPGGGAMMGFRRRSGFLLA
nr:DoxX family membrane protein [Ardenticatena sp.]